MEILRIYQRTAVDKVLRDKAFRISRSPRYDGFQGGLASTVYKVFDNKNSGGAAENKILSN